MKKLIGYIRKNVDLDEVKHTISKMGLRREPLSVANPSLWDKVYDLAEEYSADRDLPEGWWQYEMEVDDIIYEL